MIDDTLMRFEEKIGFRLRSLYGKYGYRPYKMSKFEEYELYIRNKDFLVSDRVIAFNDTNGKLMALKPDVTLSIIKNTDDTPGVKQKVCYNENVYRVSESTNRFREIMQTGLECIGDIDIYDIYETIVLAAESLRCISENFCLEICDLDIVSSVVAGVCGHPDFLSSAMRCISQKNPHDLRSVCDAYSVKEDDYLKIASLISLYGKRKDVLKGLRGICGESALERMTLLSELLDASPLGERISFDFSVINDMSYYNGFVFRGFIDGVSRGVLAGGQYDRMMRKMNRSSGAVGFALYLDRLDEMKGEKERCDADVLLLYDDAAAAAEVVREVERLISSGMSVSAQKSVPEKMRYIKIVDLRRKEGAGC